MATTILPVTKKKTNMTKSTLLQKRTGDPLAPQLVLNQTSLTLAYLASPYSPKGIDDAAAQEVIKAARFIEAAQAAKWLMENQDDLNVFSPIVHSHVLHLQGMRGDWAFWQKVDTDYIFLSDMLIILTIPGWRESVGVTAEAEIARRFGMEVLYLRKTPTGYQLRKRP